MTERPNRGRERQQICHWDEDTQSYVLLTAAANSAHFTRHENDVAPVDGACPETASAPAVDTPVEAA